MNVALVDYGAGNVRSVIKALTAVGAAVDVVDRAESLEGAQAIIIPGVGHFSTTASLGAAWRDQVRRALDRGSTLLGVCVGLQWLFEGSAEAPNVPGFGAMPGHCFRLAGDVKVPHVGWNTIEKIRSSRLLEGIPNGASAYFTHSYAPPVVADTIAVTTHAAPFSAAVERDRIFGAQFHPEKSGETGLAMLRNFLRIAGEAS